MKAIIQNKYGDETVLELADVQKPTIKDNELLVETHYANIASGDMRVNKLDVPSILKPIVRLVFGWSKPRSKVRGITGSGIIVEKGSLVNNYNIGDKVYYINSMKAGCMGEYLVLNNKSIMAKAPDNIELEQAAPLAFGAMTALHYFHKDAIKKGMDVLVYGASGSVGTYAVQLAKHYGAKVTGVSSKKNHEVLKSLGCDNVIDYKTEDFTLLDKKYDVVLDTVMKTKKKQVKKVLKPNGKYMTTAAPTKELVSRLEVINTIVEEGNLISYIEKVYPFNEFKQAHKHVYGKHKVGNVVLKIK